MASALYLENFLESIENLPQELQRNFTLMRDLDKRTQDILGEIQVSSDEYRLQGSKGQSRDDQKQRLKKIHESYQKAKDYSDNKVQLAMQMYEMVDKHIRRLDGDLARFEQELQMKETPLPRSSVSSYVDHQNSASNKNRKHHHGELSAGALKKRKKSSDLHDIANTSSPSVPQGPAGGGTSDVLDMPVDPNEPTYCICHQVSFGEMIGCDNPDCAIEWFHFQCVGLTSKPKGKWYCQRCSQERDRSKKKY